MKYSFIWNVEQWRGSPWMNNVFSVSVVGCRMTKVFFGLLRSRSSCWSRFSSRFSYFICRRAAKIIRKSLNSIGFGSSIKIRQKMILNFSVFQKIVEKSKFILDLFRVELVRWTFLLQSVEQRLVSLDEFQIDQQFSIDFDFAVFLSFFCSSKEKWVFQLENKFVSNFVSPRFSDELQQPVDLQQFFGFEKRNIFSDDRRLFIEFSQSNVEFPPEQTDDRWTRRKAFATKSNRRTSILRNRLIFGLGRFPSRNKTKEFFLLNCSEPRWIDNSHFLLFGTRRNFDTRSSDSDR